MLTEEQRERLEIIESIWHDGRDGPLNVPSATWVITTLRSLADLPTRGDVLTEFENRQLSRYKEDCCKQSELWMIAIIDRLMALPIPRAAAVCACGDRCQSPGAACAVCASGDGERIRKDERGRCVGAAFSLITGSDVQAEGWVRGVNAAVRAIEGEPDEPMSAPDDVQPTETDEIRAQSTRAGVIAGDPEKVREEIERDHEERTRATYLQFDGEFAREERIRKGERERCVAEIKDAVAKWSVESTCEKSTYVAHGDGMLHAANILSGSDSEARPRDCGSDPHLAGPEFHLSNAQDNGIRAEERQAHAQVAIAGFLAQIVEEMREGNGK